MQKYLADYHAFIKNTPWYYRMTRSFFNEQLFDLSIYQESKIGTCNAIFNMTERLIAFSNKQNPIARWLHIPTHLDHQFRTMLITDSNPS